MSKPSEKIFEIKDKLPSGYPEPHRTIKAILNYLDETYEQQKHCEHKLNKGRLDCEDCGLAREEW